MNFGLGLCDDTLKGLNLSLAGGQGGIFSAPCLTPSRLRALLNPPMKPSLVALLVLNFFGLWDLPWNISDGEGKYGDESTGVGDLANRRGGEEDSRIAVDIALPRAGPGHVQSREDANADFWNDELRLKHWYCVCTGSGQIFVSRCRNRLRQHPDGDQFRTNASARGHTLCFDAMHEND